MTTNTTMKAVMKIFETVEQMNERYSKTLIPFAIVLGVLAFVGIIGNALVITVFATAPEYKKTNFKTFVIFLAVIDLFTCLTLLPAEVAKVFSYFSMDPVLCKLKCFFNLFANTAASLTLFVICIDRYRRVCQPLKKQIWPSLALKILIIVMFVTVVLCSPAPLMCGITEVNKTNIYNTTTTVYYCSAENKYHNSVFRYVYKISLTAILLGLAVAFIVMYTMVGRIIIIQWRLRRQAGSNMGVVTTFKSSKCTNKFKSDSKCVRGVGDLTENDKIANNNTKTPYKFIRKFDTNKSSENSTSKVLARQDINRNKMRKSESVMCTPTIPRRSSHNTGKIPYKTLIWLILTLVFLVTYFLNASLSFLSTKQDTMTPNKLLLYSLLNRLYFVNNVINPIVYACLDKRFKASCKSLLTLMKRKMRGIFQCQQCFTEEFE